ncbi:MAG: hypothetical protein ACI8QZ_002467 [Chlamydiales bacterium]|jgi:hypothetical protein
MTHGYRIKNWTVLTLLCMLGACSSSSDDGISLVSVVQDLVVDADGLTTRIVFSEDPGGIGASNFTASAGQSPTAVSKTSNVVQVVWSARVTRSHTIRVVGKPGVSSVPRSVTTTDSSAPTFVITSAIQDTADGLLGGDRLTITFSGARVVATDVVDNSNWALTVNSSVLDWTGSGFNFTEATQVLTVTLGAAANLHTNLTLAATSLMSVADVPLATTGVAGVATGDASALTAPTVEQRLAVDALGRVVDFIFAKPMDPVSSVLTSAFTVNDHGGSTTITLPLSVAQVADNTLRVTFSAPIVPGLDTVALNSIAGYHGNTYAGTEAIANTSPAVNAYTSVSATTVENLGGDTVVAVTDQAFDPDLAILPAGWTLTVDGNPVTMADQTLTYDLSTRALTIELDFDMGNTDAIVLTAVGLTDVDGQTFNGAPGFGVTASGDSTKPTLVSAMQNRTIDTSGNTVDVTFSEDLDPTAATNTALYGFSPAVVTNTAALVGGSGRVVRLVTNTAIVPGDFTFSVVGLVADLAGETLDLGATAPVAIATTDTQDPAILAITSNAIEGADNDALVVLFNDTMVSAEVESAVNWVVESPSGTPIDVTGCTVIYANDSATMTLDSGSLALKSGDTVRVVLNTMRDVGGRTISATPGTGAVVGEANLPLAHQVWRDMTSTDQLVLHFSEPCDRLQDLFNASTNVSGSRFAIRDNDMAQTLRGYPLSATILNGGLGVRLAYGFVIDLDDTLDVLGVTDLAGNYMFPAMSMDIADEVVSVPAQDGGGVITALEGEDNDRILVSFGQEMSPWKLLDPSQYTVVLNGGGGALDLTGATLEIFTANPTQVLMTLDNGASADAQFMADYDIQLQVDTANPLRTSQGVALATTDTETVTTTGDLREPLESFSAAFTDSTDNTVLFIAFNEAVETASVSTPADYVFNGGAATGTAVTHVSPRILRVVFDAAVSAGSNVVIAAGSEDLAGTPTPGTMTLAVTDDVAAPLLSAITPTAVADRGHDTVVVQFNEVLDLTTALDDANYTVTNGSTVIDLSAATFSWYSTDAAVTIQLPDDVDLDPAQSFTVQVDGVKDVSGNTLSGASLGAVIVGDSVAPSLQNAFTNLRENVAGNVVDMLFTEDVDATFTGMASNWSASGGQSVLSVASVDAKHYRITLATALGATDTLDITGVSDLAGNVSGALSIDPED